MANKPTSKRRTSGSSTSRTSQSLILQRAEGSEILQSNQYKSLALRSMFWRPDYLQGSSAWVEHLPFAFWIVEALQPSLFVELGTHYGHSYFSFCQAIKRLGLNTPSYAVDTWKGDDQAGHYDENVYQQVDSYNQANYPEFSSLLRCTFDEALTRFNDGSIDLLHIDGFHTYEAVRHDFESWLPKLSERAVVLFHDTNVRRDSFGVHKYFAELTQKYPYFEFIHGHGLGVLGVGKSQPELLKSLYTCYAHQASRNIVYELFSRLGRSCHDLMDLNGERTRTQIISDESQARANHIIHLEQILKECSVQEERLKGLEKEYQESLVRFKTLEFERDKLTEKLIESQKMLREEVEARLKIAAEATDKEQAILNLQKSLQEVEKEKEVLKERIKEEELGRGRLAEKLIESQKMLREEVEARLQIAAEASDKEKISQQLELRNIEMGDLSRIYLKQKLQVEASLIRNVGLAIEYQSMTRGISHEISDHQHINYRFDQVRLGEKEWDILNVRIVEHHGKPGILIFENPMRELKPLEKWIPSGSEGGLEFMLFIPDDKNGRKSLKKITKTDLILLTELSLMMYLENTQKEHDGNPKWISISEKLHARLRS
jgi:hypothetical protein